MKRYLAPTIAALLTLTLFANFLAPVRADSQPWMDTSLPPEERARLLVAEMTLEEKIWMVSGDNKGDYGGYVGHISAIPRLGIPALKMKDGPSGVGNGAMDVTAFPEPITVAATWDVALLEQYSRAMAEEQKAKGVNVHLAPMMNIVRVPQAGRNFEGYGEDPYLSAQMSAAAVRGIQSVGMMIASAKHYLANEQEIQRTRISSEVDIRTLHEIYLPPFKASVEAGVGSVMCSYNKINGIYACENSDTQNDILKGELGFKGWIVSDWNATHSTIESALGGLDMEMPVGVYYGRTLQGAVEAGQVPVSRLDDMVIRILTAMFQAGLFDAEPVGSPDAYARSDAHTALTRDSAAQGMVLVKNEGAILPLDPAKYKSIAVFGAAADANPVIVGGGSGHVNAPYVITPLQAILERVGPDVPVRYFEPTRESGSPISPEFLRAENGEAGLQVEYFNNPNLSGSPAVIETVASLDFSWQGNAPAEGISAANWSARWNGILKPTKTGMYNLAVTHASGIRLYLDDKLVLDGWDTPAEQTSIHRQRLIDGKDYALRLEYRQPAESGLVRLSWYTPENNPDQDAAAIARQSDLVIFVTGIRSSEGSDRTSMVLNEQTLIETVAAANPNTVVVLYSPAQVLMDWADVVPAILLGWIPGQEAGNSMVDVLFGDVNPAGKLPITIAYQLDDYPTNTAERYPGVGGQVHYTEGLRVGYRHFDSQAIEPRYPFGHGLSYTSFEYSNLGIDPSQTTTDGSITVSVDVKNSGTRAGAEVVQLYLGFPLETSEPPRQLKGFEKVMLQPGETKSIRFTLSPESVSFYSAGHRAWMVYPDLYEVMIGSSSRDIRQQGTFTLDGGPFSGQVIEAETATLGGGAVKQSQHAGFGGQGYIGGLQSEGDSVSFEVQVEKEAEYTLIMRYASTLRPGEQNTPRTLSLYLNGEKIDQLEFPNLANWEMWDFKSQRVTLKAGENRIAYQFDPGDNGDLHIDSLMLVETRPPASPLPGWVLVAVILLSLSIGLGLFLKQRKGAIK